MTTESSFLMRKETFFEIIKAKDDYLIEKTVLKLHEVVNLDSNDIDEVIRSVSSFVLKKLGEELCKNTAIFSLFSDCNVRTICVKLAKTAGTEELKIAYNIANLVSDLYRARLGCVKNSLHAR
jgi:hypothetical protein